MTQQRLIVCTAKRMCPVLITFRGALWISVGVIALVLQLYGILSPAWLVALPPSDGTSRNYTPSVGVFSRCTKLGDNDRHCASFAMDGFATDSSVYPAAWKAAFFFLTLCAGMHCATVLAGALACCVQAVCKKSIISLAGAVQALAGVFGVIGFLLHPWGWGAERVLALCGNSSEPFLPADCSIGLGLYASACGVALTFASSALSVPADRAADTDRLPERRHLICVT